MQRKSGKKDNWFMLNAATSTHIFGTHCTTRAERAKQLPFWILAYRFQNKRRTEESASDGETIQIEHAAKLQATPFISLLVELHPKNVKNDAKKN